MVTSGGRIPHQLPRAVGSNFSCEVICKDKCKISILLRIDNTTAVAYIIIWGYSCSLQRVGQPDKRSVDVVSREEHTHHSSTSPRSSEFHCSCGITVADRQDRLEAESLYFHKIQGIFGPLEVDLNATCLSAQCQCYFSWRPDPSAEATAAFLQV